MRFLPNCVCVVLLYGRATLPLTKMHGEKVRMERHKNATCYFEQILEATPNKTIAVRPLNSHLTNHLSKMNETYEHG